MDAQAQITFFRFGNDAPRMSPEAAAEVGRLTLELETMAATLDLEQPWTAAQAEEWDRVTFSSWLDAASDNAEALAFWRVFVPAIFAAEAHELSLLHFLFYIASGGASRCCSGPRAARRSAG